MADENQENAPVEAPVAAAPVASEPWEELDAIIETGNAAALATFLQLLPPEETTYTITSLSEEKQTRMLGLLSRERPDFAADLMEHFDDAIAADMIEELDPEIAAAIVDEMDSDEQADVLGELDEEDAEAILKQMDPEEARDARDLLRYPEDTAGGLMITEYLSYPSDADVDDVIHDLRTHIDEYEGYETRYLYIVDEDERFVSVVPFRSLITSRHGRTLHDMRIWEPITVRVDATLDELEDLFDRVDFSAAPVLDHEGRMRGVVQRSHVQEALSERSSGEFMKFSGIIGGEELRNMPLVERWLRRLTFLAPSLVLSTAAVSIIALFEDVIAQVTAIAIFLPLVANLSGAAGNQAVAVSIRELALGLVMPRDVWRVMKKEMWVGLFNGLCIGAAVGAIVIAADWIFQMDNPRVHLLAGVVTVAYVLSSVFAVCIGGALPLMLKRVKVDPAMVSSPVLTTLTDTASFFLTLSFTMLLLYLVG